MMIEEYFRTAVERETIRQSRMKGYSYPWSEDQIFNEWRFCNVFREDDRTTIWFRDNIREPLRDSIKVIPATWIFRWFNRIETGEIIKDLLLDWWDTEEARKRLQHASPLTTGAYMIKAVDDMDKLDGILYQIHRSLDDMLMIMDRWVGDKLERAWNEFLKLHGIGPFMSYEIVTDLRHTGALEEAEDIMTWANPGPGCKRGLNKVYGSRLGNDEFLPFMQELLEKSKDESYWPFERPWEMREVEHWACEYFKYKRAEDGYRLKRRFKWN